MIANLQVLRGLAALAVVFYHTAFTFNGGVHTEFQGVAVFFVISGFIMTYITRQSADQFFAQRVIRIVPLYWLFTLLAVAASGLKGTGRMWGDASGESLLESLFFIPYRDSAGDMHPLLAVGWTLNLEMFFYVLFAGALVLSTRWAPLLVCGALLTFKLAYRFGCSAAICEFYAHDYTTFLIGGVLSFYLWRALAPAARRWRAIVGPLGLLVVALFVAWNAHPPFAAGLQQFVPLPWSEMAPPLLVTAALLLHSARLEWKGTLALVLGDASYALYLTHTIVLEVYAIARSRLAGDRIILDPSQSIWAMGAVLLACCLVAVMVHYWVERPILHWLRQRVLKRPRWRLAEHLPAGETAAAP
jgi:exopolysaccharide production protein ExoZ